MDEAEVERGASPLDGAEVRVGCDVQSAASVRESIEEFGESYLRRILSGEERAAVAALADPAAVARHVCGRFAAKEAVFKLLRGAPEAAVGWPQIEILTDASGAPRVRLAGAAAELARAAGIGGISVSISHADPFAFAVAVGVAHPRPIRLL